MYAMIQGDGGTLDWLKDRLNITEAELDTAFVEVSEMFGMKLERKVDVQWPLRKVGLTPVQIGEILPVYESFLEAGSFEHHKTKVAEGAFDEVLEDTMLVLVKRKFGVVLGIEQLGELMVYMDFLREAK
jgi:hypothetical protein